MKALVLGGGVVGVTTAYFLARAGHEVTLVEANDALGLEATVDIDEGTCAANVVVKVADDTLIDESDLDCSDL